MKKYQEMSKEELLQDLLTKSKESVKIIKEKSATVQQRFTLVYGSKKATDTLVNGRLLF